MLKQQKSLNKDQIAARNMLLNPVSLPFWRILKFLPIEYKYLMIRRCQILDRKEDSSVKPNIHFISQDIWPVANLDDINNPLKFVDLAIKVLQQHSSSIYGDNSQSIANNNHEIKSLIPDNLKQRAANNYFPYESYFVNHQFVNKSTFHFNSLSQNIRPALESKLNKLINDIYPNFNDKRFDLDDFIQTKSPLNNCSFDQLLANTRVNLQELSSSQAHLSMDRLAHQIATLFCDLINNINKEQSLEIVPLINSADDSRYTKIKNDISLSLALITKKGFKELINERRSLLNELYTQKGIKFRFFQLCSLSGLLAGALWCPIGLTLSLMIVRSTSYHFLEYFVPSNSTVTDEQHSLSDLISSIVGAIYHEFEGLNTDQQIVLGLILAQTLFVIALIGCCFFTLVCGVCLSPSPISCCIGASSLEDGYAQDNELEKNRATKMFYDNLYIIFNQYNTQTCHLVPLSTSPINSYQQSSQYWIDSDSDDEEANENTRLVNENQASTSSHYRTF